MALKLDLMEHVMQVEGGEIYIEDHYTIGSYKVVRDRVQYKSGNVYEHFSLMSAKEYAPQIVYRRREDVKFLIQTTAYGAMTVGEIEEIISGYQEAVEVVEVMTKTFCK